MNDLDPSTEACASKRLVEPVRTIEVKELGPSLCTALVRQGLPAHRIALGEHLEMKHWNRPISGIDLVVHRDDNGTHFVAEPKVWDIGHQLFDLAKVCCLLARGVPGGLLICVAKRQVDFDRMPGGELFPQSHGDVRTHDFLDLIQRHREEWSRHVGRRGPEPTHVPAIVSTTAISDGVGIKAYPGHFMRAVEVSIVDGTPILLERLTQ